MSLNASQMDATRRELQVNFERSGLTADIQPMIQQYLPH